MNTHHAQENTAIQRETMGNASTRSKSKDVLCCRRTMEQLRKKDRSPERWTKKLRNERETVEKTPLTSFREDREISRVGSDSHVHHQR
ncbi:hypothetical protein TNIN_309941 [Trichonephila inaurata madagascariensis]|uniref:Uncharacterized protein n=1 Tax=Trichonephila inaurata madagascariensis TaxID=2747483 RepID=A0A8X6MB31_9ARAC|nr:hypothetical protein TNIN_309941 [Trichonephila inaurata madagascariensis]